MCVCEILQVPDTDDVPHRFGMEDGLEGESEFTGYNYFAGQHLQEYFEGHRQGVAMRQRLQGAVLTVVRQMVEVRQ